MPCIFFSFATASSEWLHVSGHMNEYIPGSSIPAPLDGRKTTQCLSPLSSFYRNLQNTPRCILTLPDLTRKPIMCSVVRSKNNVSYHSPKYSPEFYALKLTELRFCFCFPTEGLQHRQEGSPPHLLPATLVERSPITRQCKALPRVTCHYIIPIGLNFFLKDYSGLVDLVESAVFFMALSVTVLKIIPRALTPPRLSVPFLLR